ncbi:hypothetical protein V6N13_038237 [Hibiscus sabdariffa]
MRSVSLEYKYDETTSERAMVVQGVCTFEGSAAQRGSSDRLLVALHGGNGHMMSLRLQHLRKSNCRNTSFDDLSYNPGHGWCNIYCEHIGLGPSDVLALNLSGRVIPYTIVRHTGELGRNSLTCIG